MKMNLPFALLGAAALVAGRAWAEDSTLVARQSGEAAEARPAAASAPVVTTTSRGEPIVASNSREGAPVPRPATAQPAAPVPSRPLAGSIIRSIITDIVQETSHIVVTADTTPAHYRYTGATQFMDEEGRVLSADAVKSGINATLHYTQSEGDLVLTKVIVNGAYRPLAARQIQGPTEVPFDR